MLANELNHRVKNLFAVILAIVQMSARDAPEAKPVTNSIAERIRALLTAHEVTQGSLDKPVAQLSSLVETTIAPYLSADRTAVTDGPEVILPAKQVTPLGLVLHELATNAVKYGCWAQGGNLEVRWQRARRPGHRSSGTNISPDQRSEPERVGFGSLLMNGSAQQLGGTIDRKFTADGVRVVITMKDKKRTTSYPTPSHKRRSGRARAKTCEHAVKAACQLHCAHRNSAPYVGALSFPEFTVHWDEIARSLAILSLAVVAAYVVHRHRVRTHGATGAA